MFRRLLGHLIPNTIYIQVKANEFTVKHIESGRTCRRKAVHPFTTSRLLIGNFVEAESLLRECLREVVPPLGRLIRPRAVIHPLEMVEGGICGIEQRVLFEVVSGAGAEVPHIWVGSPLSNSAVKEKAREI
jgi:rod shape-determining protein MreB